MERKKKKRRSDLGAISRLTSKNWQPPKNTPPPPSLSHSQMAFEKSMASNPTAVCGGFRLHKMRLFRELSSYPSHPKNQHSFLSRVFPATFSILLTSLFPFPPSSNYFSRVFSFFFDSTYGSFLTRQLHQSPEVRVRFPFFALFSITPSLY